MGEVNRHGAAAGVLALLGLLAAAPSAKAYPAFSAWWLPLPLTAEACNSQVQASFRTEGWGDISPDGVNWVRARKGAYIGVVSCVDTSSGNVVANIFIATDAPDPTGELTRSERDRLRDNIWRSTR